MSLEPNHPAFDSEEHAILSAIVPELESVEEGDTAQPDASQAPAAPAAPAQAQPAEGQTAEPAAAAQSQPAEASPATPEPAQPQGDARAALRASRRAEKRLRDELEDARRQIEDLRQGKAPVDTSISDEELTQLEQDFPLQAKIVRNQRRLEEELAQTRQSQQQQPAGEFEPLYYEPEVQEVIDEVPQLLAWQNDATKQGHFLKAIDYDKSLNLDPDWKDRPAAERFAEAARRAEASLAPRGQPTPSAAPNAAPAAPAAPRLDPKAVIDGAPVQGPKGISDFRGGAPASTPATQNYANWSDEQIMASLPVQS